MGGLLGGKRVGWPPLSNYWGEGGGVGGWGQAPMRIGEVCFICD